MQINVGRAFNPGADDPEGWKKAAIFALITVACTFGTLLVLPGLFLMMYLPGFMLANIRNVATGENQGKLPEPLGVEFLWHGFISMLVVVIYSLPLMGISLLALGGAAAGLAGMANNSAMAGLGSLASLGVLGVAALAVVFLTLCFVPMIMLQYCKRYQFGDCFNFAAIFAGIARNPVDYAIIVLVPMGLNFALGMIPFAALLAPAVNAVVAGHLYGQYGARYLEMGGAEEPRGTGFSSFE